jgi:beta-galactosidase
MSDLLPLRDNWEFRRLGEEPGAAWTQVSLPHTPFITGLDGEGHWFGLCEYARSLRRPAGAAPGSRLLLRVGAAMHSATVLLDGVRVASHSGGYLPFSADLTEGLSDDREHRLSLVLDNREDAAVPPGKPFGELDFCWFGGLHREVSLEVLPPVHITDALAEDLPAGGGLFFRTLEADDSHARVHLRVHVRNSGSQPAPLQLSATLSNQGTTVASGRSAVLTLDPGEATHVELELLVEHPALWSPASPVLQQLHVNLLGPEDRCLDSRALRVGLRRIGFSRSGGFTVNGRRLRLRGTNRHAEFPRVGYAAGPAAERRDARRIKEAGFDYVRLSHYPQSPAFMDACDELGIVVMNAIPGWQFLGGEAFREACYRNARDLIRRDRNHACVVLWELSLNETQMDEAFMARLHAIGHEEYPGDQMFTCGWMDAYDVYIHSRQHGGIHSWSNGDKAHIVAEYGDWEFYAANHGFDQTTGAGVHDQRSNARQRRGDGERALRQQAHNHTIALNDTLHCPAVLDGQWSVFDYSRGYHPERAACGVMDLHRIPKFSYHFYRSQREPQECGPGWTGGPVAFIASLWTPASDLRVVVYSNCEEISLRLNGVELERHRPWLSWMTQYLPHPPFVFDLPRFTPGRLEAIGYIEGNPVASHSVATPGLAHSLRLEADTLGLRPLPGEQDVLAVHASILDQDGTLCVGAQDLVSFSVDGPAEILDPDPVAAEAGIASVTLRRKNADGIVRLRASAGGLPPAELELG